MNNLLKRYALATLSRGNVHLTRRTDQRNLLSLLEKLTPVSFGGDLIRLGPRGDGGYLVPDMLEKIDACFSPGVNKISRFEADCADRGMKVFLADASVDAPAESHRLFHFTKKYIGVTTNDRFMTLDDWIETSSPDSAHDLMLQIDIEGFEYEVFLNASDRLMRRFKIIVAEFHRLHELWNKPFFELASRVFEKLLQTHACVHNHPNNRSKSLITGDVEIPMLTELTFLRRDCVKDPRPLSSFPHPLDCDNVASRPTLTLPRSWY